MALQLRENLHWCDCGGRAVFLDARADRYFCLTQTANDAFLRLAAGGMGPGDAERLHTLVARGMLIEAGAAVPVPPPRIDPPTHDFVENPAPRASLLSIARALASELRAAWLLRTKPFHAVIATAQKGRGRGNGSTVEPDRLVEKIVSASTALSVVARRHDRCLVRALAVHSMCRRSRIGTRLVFGVIAHPFTAHCWVQLGSAVLVGEYEQARLYTPILVVE